jgi:hypothetical protein
MKLKNCKVGMTVRVKSLEEVQDESFWSASDNYLCDKEVVIYYVYGQPCDFPVDVQFGSQYFSLSHKALRKINNLEEAFNKHKDIPMNKPAIDTCLQKQKILSKRLNEVTEEEWDKLKKL